MRSLFDVSGKVVLVTGGSRGIGEMIARGYAENGARVYISSRKAAACEELSVELSKIGFCRALPFDLAQEEGIAGLVAGLAEQETQLDILINNAGATWAAPLDDYPREAWDKVVDLNMKSVFYLSTAMLPMLRAGATPWAPSRIINIASVNGIAPPAQDTFAYAASKAGCIMITRHLAKRLADEDILVNAIAPGPFPSKMMAGLLQTHGDEIRASIPLGRIGEPEDIAGVAIFLGSRASAYTTGAVIPCDGGAVEV